MKKNCTITLLFVLFSFKLATAQCSPPVASADLDISNVRARLLTSGSMWWDTTGARYEVPKGTGKTSIFAGGLWIAGIDPGGQLRTACMTNGQGGNDFWPGPDGTLANCIAYDRIWKLNKPDVVNFVNTGTTTVQDIIDYPGNSPGSNVPLAPYFDNNGDGIYNYLDGDYPYFNLGTGSPDCCDILHGDQCLWWVINDVGNVHTVTNSPPIGLEIRCQAYAFDSAHTQTINSTFYQYTMINRSGAAYSHCYFGQWVDADLGFYLDDYIGCDVEKGVGYCYNGDWMDNLPDGYGATPPAIGVDILHGPFADPGDGIDNDRNGIIDEPGEDVTLSKLVSYANNNDPIIGAPIYASHYYSYLKGFWKNGGPMTYGGNGYNPLSTNYCNFMCPNATDPQYFSTLGPWTEEIAGNIVDDRILLNSAGEFTLLPGAVHCITIGVVWARADSGDNRASIPLMLTADSIIQLIFDSCFTDFSTNVNQLAEGTVSGIAPNPFSDKTIIHFNNPAGENFSFKLFDINGALIKNILNIKKNFLIVERENLKSGMYIFKLSGESGKVSSGKLMVE
ncbi:MAG TPA: T9SS type A sorting domain-containing protein [Bacteroidia bacterium]|nr:T9SS type A sorting domain-containing protein [Bacteroidia bacterium]